MPETPNFKLREPPPPPTSVARSAVPYAEMEVTTNFSFLRGASHPDELVYRAAELGYRAIGITDHCTLAGMVRAHAAAKKCGMKLVVGSRLIFEDAPELLVWAPNRKAYANLCRLLTLGKRRAKKVTVTFFSRILSSIRKACWRRSYSLSRYSGRGNWARSATCSAIVCPLSSAAFTGRTINRMFIISQS